MQAVSNAEQRYMLQHDEYARAFEDLDIEIPNKSTVKMAKKVTLITDNFDISLSTVNEDALIMAGRKATKSLGPNDNHSYVLYKHLVTGELFCEDANDEDRITCDLFAINGLALTCDDGSVSLTGEGGCKKAEEKKEIKEPVKDKKAEEEKKK